MLIIFGTYQHAAICIIFWDNHSHGALMLYAFPINGISVQLGIRTPQGYSRSSICCYGIHPIGHHFPCHLGAPRQGGISVKNTTEFRGAL